LPVLLHINFQLLRCLSRLNPIKAGCQFLSNWQKRERGWMKPKATVTAFQKNNDLLILLSQGNGRLWNRLKELSTLLQTAIRVNKSKL